MVTNMVGETVKWLAKPQPLCLVDGEDETEYDQAYELGEGVLYDADVRRGCVQHLDQRRSAWLYFRTIMQEAAGRFPQYSYILGRPSPAFLPFLRSRTYTAQSSVSLRSFNQLPLGLQVCAQSSDDKGQHLHTIVWTMSWSSSSGPIHHVPKAPRRHLTNEPADGTLNRTHLSPTTSSPTTTSDGHNYRPWIAASKIPHSAHPTPPCVGAFH
ncbi:hypothetical protein EDB85DRAFT_362960 [Lactarius pseudohatsudake]|nr:hypothetical protein EDB85DRAFT_362960 [Lactarius pseudohatsudake]